jgi:uncharacterized circularly permuted ATP-grasp superfamily protein
MELAQALHCQGREVDSVRLAFDEMKGSDGRVRPAYTELAAWLGEVRPDVLDYRRREAELLFRRIGITFAVYGEADAQERLIPFDVIPRLLSAAEWDLLRRGLEQRVKAINLYLRDHYGRREILRAGIVPDDMVFQNPVFRPEMNGQKVPHDIYVHVAGIDVVRVDADTFYVLEDNVRTPSGVSYMLENREIMMRLFPDLYSRHRVAPVENYPDELLATLKSVAPASASSDPPSFCCRPASTTRPITSIRSWPTSSASSWSKAATCSCAAASSTCARRRGRSAST